MRSQTYYDFDIRHNMTLAEYNALVALYNSTGGPSWSNRTGWLVTETPCTWYGITCASNHVTGIVLNTNNLDSTLPNLSALTGLTTLFGFVSFATVKLTIVRDLGLFTAAGIFFAIIIALTLIPAGYCFSSKKVHRRSQNPVLIKFLSSLSRFVLKNPIMIASARNIDPMINARSFTTEYFASLNII